MKKILPSDPHLQYMGRIDFSDPDAPDFIWAGSLVQFGFTGSYLSLTIRNHVCYNGLQIGFLLDCKEYQLALESGHETCREYVLPVETGGKHTITIFKRQDSTHHFRLLGIGLGDDGALYDLPALPELKIECYGDSVSAGSVVEAVDCVGKTDPPVYDSVYDNAWHSYAMQTARLMNAQIHLVAQGGIALFDNTGYFDNGRYGLETAYNKLNYLPDAPKMTLWDFSRYIPDIVIMAIGQNDQHAEGQDGIFTPEKRERWLEAYCGILKALMQKYPNAQFVLLLTILMHDEYWEELLDDACARIGEPRVTRLRFTRSGKATPGHPRIPEQCEMACELTEYLNRIMCR